MDKVLCRRVLYKNKEYFQLLRELNEDETEYKELDETNEDYFYLDCNLSFLNLELGKDFIIGTRVEKNTNYLTPSEKIAILNNPILLANVLNKFHEKYNDFELATIDNYDIYKLEDDLNEHVPFQTPSISKLIDYIQEHYELLENPNINKIEKTLSKKNICIYGETGFGLESILSCIIDNSNIPVAEIEIGKNIKETAKNIISKLLETSNNNLYLAEKGIVIIRDNLDEIDDVQLKEKLDLTPYDIIRLFVEPNLLTISNRDERFDFDTSNLLFILEQKTKKANKESLREKGFDSRIEDLFPNIVKVNSFDRTGVYSVLKFLNLEELINSFTKTLGVKIIIEDIEGIYNKMADIISTYKGGFGLIAEILLKVLILQQKEEQCKINPEIIDRVIELSELELKSDTVIEKVEEKDFKIDMKEIRKSYREKYNYLIKYIKGQNESLKEILYYVVYNDLIQNSRLDMRTKKDMINHILIKGNPGCGKTYIASMIASTFKDKPVVIVDATEYTETGYVGKSVTDMLIQLLMEANGDVKKAQKGILIIDEFDKKADSKDSKDISRGAVQNSLLKMFEGTVFDLEIGKGMSSKHIQFDTSELTIICCGAFEGLEDIRDYRLKTSVVKNKSLGFGEQEKNDKEYEEKVKELNTDFTTEDYEKFGIHSQILRRLKVHRELNKLSKEDFKDIMLNSEDSEFKIEIERLESLGLIVEYDEEFINAFVDKAYNMGYGVSSLGIIFSDVIQYITSDILSGEYIGVKLTKECLDNPKLVEFIEKEKVKKL